MNVLTLLFGVHAHQPAGNFPEVVEQAHRACYAPFLRTLADYPAFRCAVHVSGPLLDTLARQFAEDIALLRMLVARGQVELFGAGDTEPVLAAIPARDRAAQLAAMSARLQAQFGAHPRGAWLTERVWEPTVVPALADAGIRYTVVDDYHFFCTGRRADELDGYFTTEEDERRLDLFAISEELRYRIPFSPAPEAVRYLESLAHAGRDAAAVYFDDIEKFGVWPETHEWVYARRWLRDFIEGVLASPRLRSASFADYHASARTRGIVYLPTTSYSEMNAWSLPPAAAAEYESLLRQERDAGRLARRKGFVRGGIWRNFFSRYPEANWMHKRMLMLSARLARQSLSEHDSAELARLLHLAQANDAYWHGLFGGLYLPHLRRSVWRHLLALEARLDRIESRPAAERLDADSDGFDEIFLHNDALQVVLRIDGTAAVREFADYRLQQNFADTLRRHAEAYHELARRGAPSAAARDGIASAHERVAFRHAIEAHEVAPDPAPRDLFVDAWEGEALAQYALQSVQDAAVQFAAGGQGVPHVIKRLALRASTLSVRYEIRTGHAGTFSTRLDLAMPACDGFAGRYVIAGEVRGGFGQPLQLPQAAAITLDDRFMRGAVTVECDPPAAIQAAPYHTVSQSEEGFERVMQSASLVLTWPVAIGETAIEVRVKVSADTAETPNAHPLP